MAIDIGSADEDMSSEDNPSSDQGGITSVDSDIELSSSDVDMESEPEKKAGMRKPTKRALENSMNEVSVLVISDMCLTRETHQIADTLFSHRQTATQEHIRR